MPDPKLQKLADYLRANYVPASPVGPVTIEQRVPVTPAPAAAPMDPGTYRVDRYVRGVPANLPQADPALVRQMALAAALRRGGKAGGQR